MWLKESTKYISNPLFILIRICIGFTWLTDCSHPILVLLTLSLKSIILPLQRTMHSQTAGKSPIKKSKPDTSRPQPPGHTIWTPKLTYWLCLSQFRLKSCWVCGKVEKHASLSQTCVAPVSSRPCSLYVILWHETRSVWTHDYSDLNVQECSQGVPERSR